jgi:hypothetical protein
MKTTTRIAPDMTDTDCEKTQKHFALVTLLNFQLDCIDIASRIRSLKGTRVDGAATLKVACDLVWSRADRLFSEGYEGCPSPLDDQLLRLALAEYERDRPEDFTALSKVTKTLRLVAGRPLMPPSPLARPSFPALLSGQRTWARSSWYR